MGRAHTWLLVGWVRGRGGLADDVQKSNFLWKVEQAKEVELGLVSLITDRQVLGRAVNLHVEGALIKWTSCCCCFFPPTGTSSLKAQTDSAPGLTHPPTWIFWQQAVLLNLLSSDESCLSQRAMCKFFFFSFFFFFPPFTTATPAAAAPAGLGPSLPPRLPFFGASPPWVLRNTPPDQSGWGGGGRGEQSKHRSLKPFSSS